MTHAPRDRPLLIVNTGEGKGKSTAAFGMVLRAWARGYRVGVYQFMKSGKWKVGEEKAARALGTIGPAIVWEKMGDGWTWTSAVELLPLKSLGSVVVVCRGSRTPRSPS